MLDVVYYKNSTLVTLLGVKNVATNTAINNATVQVLSITKYGGSPIDTNLFPISVEYVGGTQGTYRGVLPHTLTLEPTVRYVCKIKVVTVELFEAYWEFIFTCNLRTD